MGGESSRSCLVCLFVLFWKVLVLGDGGCGGGEAVVYVLG